MLKPHLLRPVAGELHNQTEQMKAPEPLFGAGAASFARGILERADGEVLYPEVWLELLHQQQAAEAAAEPITETTQVNVDLHLHMAENLTVNRNRQEIQTVTEQLRQNVIQQITVNPTEQKNLRQITVLTPRREQGTASMAMVRPMTGDRGPMGLPGSPGKTGLTAHKQEFLRLLEQADREEQERIWALTTESSELAVRDLRQDGQETPRETVELLRQTVTKFTEREYRRWLELLRRELTVRETVETTHREETREEQLLRQLRQAQPVLDILRQALTEKRMVRETVLEEIRTLPETAERAFLSLSEESGTLHKTRNHSREELTREQQLETVIRKTRRQELTDLVAWTEQRSRELSQTTALHTAEHHENTETQTTVTEHRETEAMHRMKTLLSETRLHRRTAVLDLLERMSEEERTALTAAAVSRLPKELPAESLPESPLVYLMEQTTDPEALAEQLLQAPEVKQLTEQRTLEQTVHRQLTEFTRSRGEDRKVLTERLLDSLSTTEQQLLLRKLDEHQLVRQTREERSHETLRTQLESCLDFRTQKEFKSFRYQINQLLQQEPAPAELHFRQLRLLAAEGKTRERLELKTALETLTGNRPAVWKKALLGTEPAAEAPSAPAETEEETLAALAAGRGPIYHRLTRILEQEPPQGIVEERLETLLRSLPRTGIVRAVQQETAPRPVSRETAPLELLKPHQPELTPTATRKQAEKLLKRAEAGAITKFTERIRARAPAGKHTPAATLAQRPAPVIHHPPAAEAVEAAIVHHTLPSLSRETARQLAVHAAEEAETLVNKVREETLTEQKLTGPKQLVEHLERHTLEQILLHAPADVRETRISEERWALPRAARVHRKATVLSALEPDTPPQDLYSERREATMALRREAPREPAAPQKAVDRTVEIAIAKHSPQIQLLKTAQQEGTIQLQQQAREISDLRQQLEEQTTLLQKAVEKTSRETAQQPQQLRTMVRSVMKEMEGQLRLERQRRGLS